jgi:hypothetical protein
MTVILRHSCGSRNPGPSFRGMATAEAVKTFGNAHEEAIAVAEVLPGDFDERIVTC